MTIMRKHVHGMRIIRARAQETQMASPTSETIGFIGVGLMGHGMARNILAKGYALTIMANRNRVPVDDLIGQGAVEAKTPREIAARSRIVFLCVTGSAQVEALVRGPDGLAAGARPGHGPGKDHGMVIVDCSTADPASTMALAAELAPKGIHFCDAPLGGTPAQAQEGKLSAMVGASEEIFARIKPVCETWAQKVTHLGPVGLGHKMKLINNFVAMGYGALFAEALALGQKVGVTPQIFDSVIRGSRMDSGFYQTFMSYVLDRNRDSHKFTLVNALKDMRYVEALADSVSLSNPLGNAVKNSYALACASGMNEDYVPMLSDFIAELNGTSLVEKG
jgi:3-hydroxyisobutyrate dehydrogenase-like beta-hydroxyacid dehydrogenase